MNTLDLPVPTFTPLAPARMRQFQVYDDFAAGVAARWLAGEIRSVARRNCEETSEMWKIDVAMQFGKFREMTMQDAGEADVLIVAVSAAGEPSSAFLEWLEELAPWRANRPHPGLLVGLLGEAATEAVELDVLTLALGQFARSAEMEFIWQPMGVHAMGDSDWVMPALERLISRR